MPHCYNVDRIFEIKLNKTAQAAMDQISKAFGTSEGFWLGLQADYDLEAKKAEIVL